MIRGVDIEFFIQRVVGHNGRAATLKAGPFFITNLSPYARQTRKASNPVGADVFVQVAQIIVQLVPPGRLRRHRLSGNGHHLVAGSGPDPNQAVLWNHQPCEAMASSCK